jgi:hypothetical protein
MARLNRSVAPMTSDSASSARQYAPSAGGSPFVAACSSMWATGATGFAVMPKRTPSTAALWGL